MPGISCGVGTFLRQAPPEEAKAVLDAVESGVRYRLISDALRSFGYRIAACTLSRHFRGICLCDADRPVDRVGSAATLAEALQILKG